MWCKQEYRNVTEEEASQTFKVPDLGNYTRMHISAFYDFMKQIEPCAVQKTTHICESISRMTVGGAAPRFAAHI